MDLFKKVLITVLKEESEAKIDLKSLPADILNTLDDEYGKYYKHKFDWNSKADEFEASNSEMSKWIDEMDAEGLVKNIDTVIQKVRQDLILKIKQKNSKRVLEDFEDLIKPTLGNSVLCEPLNKFMEYALLHLHSTKEIGDAFKEAENIIDDDGSLNYSKIEPSTIFVGGDINLPKFEAFAKKNPDYKGVFDSWKKIFDKYIELSSAEFNSYRTTVDYKTLRKLYDFLLDLKKKAK